LLAGLVPWSIAGMSNVVSDDKRHEVFALGRLGWSLRRIELPHDLSRPRVETGCRPEEPLTDSGKEIQGWVVDE
jgi:hypothetical protein